MVGQRIRRLLRLRRFSAGDAVREVDDEVRLHVELRAGELMRAGLDETSALAEARRLFARDERTLRALYATAIERDRHMRTRERFESIMQDVRYAARGLVRDPAVTGFVLITLALGIGANVTAWSLVDRLLVRDPPHVADPDRVVRLYGEVPRGDAGPRVSSWIPYSAFLQFRELRSFDAVGAYRIGDTLVGRGTGARRLRVGRTLGAFFPLLGVAPVAGRMLGAGDDAATDGELAILGHGLWHSSYGDDPRAVGQTIVVDDVPHTIIGVAPAGFSGTESRRVDVWTLGDSRSAGRTNWTVVGRLRAGVSREAAGAEATARHVPDETGSFKWFHDVRMFTAPLSRADDGTEPVEATLARWLTAVTAIILLITFANVVNLLLVRVARRRRELAIRVSLGAGRGRVIRLIAAEGALIAVASGLASLVVASVMEPFVRRALMADQAGWSFSLGDGRVLGLVAAIVLLTMVCVGIVPALQAGNPRVSDGLRDGVRAGSGSLRVRGTLTVVQAALSVLLLVGAGLFVRSFSKVRQLDLGVDRAGLITVDAILPPFSNFGAGVFEDVYERERDVFERLAAAVRTVPGVAEAAVAVGLPLDGGWFSAAVFIDGRDSIPSLPGRGPWVSAVNASYFDAIGTRILRGRPFSDSDREGSEPVIIVNETMARSLWPDYGALGECVHAGSRTAPCARIVGIAADVHRVGLREAPSFQYYLPLEQQRMFGGARLVVRPGRDAVVPPGALRQAIVDAEPAVRAVEIHSLTESMEGEMRPMRIGLITFGISGALALIVALLGLYSLMAYMVAWRTHEIGVRVALGATRGDVVRQVLGSGMSLAAAGVAAGLALAALAGPWIQPRLFDTSARDAVVMAAVACALLLAAAFAGWIPARRATRISPTEALRCDWRG